MPNRSRIEKQLTNIIGALPDPCQPGLSVAAQEYLRGKVYAALELVDQIRADLDTLDAMPLTDIVADERQAREDGVDSLIYTIFAMVELNMEILQKTARFLSNVELAPTKPHRQALVRRHSSVHPSAAHLS